MRAYAFDANAIHAFQEERLSSIEGAAHAALKRIFLGDCVALDDSGFCLQEWINCAGGKVPFALTDWVSNQLIMGTIREFSLAKLNMFRELSSLSLPKGDHKWVKLAISCGGNAIITNDVDFFDATKKRASEVVKQRLKERGGACSKFLMRRYGVEVMCMIRFANDMI